MNGLIQEGIVEKYDVDLQSNVTTYDLCEGRCEAIFLTEFKEDEN